MGNRNSSSVNFTERREYGNRYVTIRKGGDFMVFRISGAVGDMTVRVEIDTQQVGPPDRFGQGIMHVDIVKQETMLKIFEDLLELFRNELGVNRAQHINNWYLFFQPPGHKDLCLNITSVCRELVTNMITPANVYMSILRNFYIDSIEIYGRLILEDGNMQRMFLNDPEPEWILDGHRYPLNESERNDPIYINRECSEINFRKLINKRKTTKPVFLTFDEDTGCPTMLKIIPGPITLEHLAQSLFRTTLFNAPELHKAYTRTSEYNLVSNGEWINRCTVSCKDGETYNNIKLSLYVIKGQFVIKISRAYCNNKSNSKTTTSELLLFLLDSINRMSWRKSFVALKLLEANTVEMDLRDTESGAIQTVVFQLEGDNSKETITSFKALSLYPLTFQFEEARLTRASFDHGLSEQELDYFEKAVNTEIIVTGLVEVTAEKIMAGNVYKLSQARRAISGKRWHMPPVELVTVKTQS